MPWKIRKSFKIFAAGSSLRKRVAYSLAIVRLILVPVIFLAVYYLFVMGRIVDRIVNVDAPAAKLAEQASIEMLEARRAARNYALLRGPEYLQTNQKSLTSDFKSWFVLGILSLATKPSFSRVSRQLPYISSDSLWQFRRWRSRGKNPSNAFGKPCWLIKKTWMILSKPQGTKGEPS